MSGTEYKIKQLVSKLPSDKKARGTEKLNSMVSSLKKKGLKEKDIISRLDAKADNIDRLVAFSKKSDLKKAAIIAGSSLLGAGAAAGGAYAANKATGGKLAAWGEDKWNDVKEAAGDAKDWTLMQLANGKTAVVDATGKIQGIAGDVFDKTMSKFSHNGVVVSEPEQAVAGPTPVTVDAQDTSVAAYFSKKSKAKKAAAIAGAIAGTAGAGYGAYAAMPHIKEGIDTYKTGAEFKENFEGKTPDVVSGELYYTKGRLNHVQGELEDTNRLVDDYRNYMSKSATIKTPENADKLVTIWGDFNRTKAENEQKLADGEITDYYTKSRMNTRAYNDAYDEERNLRLGTYFKPLTDGFKFLGKNHGSEWVKNVDTNSAYYRQAHKSTDAAPVTPENAANDGKSDVVEYFYSNKWDNWF